jgi:ribosomal protein S27E
MRPAIVQVLCNSCCAIMMEDSGEFVVRYAWNPVFVPRPGHGLVLAALLMHEISSQRLLRSKKVRCEGCGRTVYVHKSSQWLLDLKEKLETP